MSNYEATIRWTRGTDEFLHQKYSRGHTWHFDEGVTVPASASPHVVRPPMAVAAAVDPEEALVASVSSCHMLFFLSGASRAGYVVERYEDAATGEMTKNDAGKLAITRVVLRPQVTFHGALPSSETFADLHHHAHEQCYIANSIRGEVAVEPAIVT